MTPLETAVTTVAKEGPTQKGARTRKSCPWTRSSGTNSPAARGGDNNDDRTTTHDTALTKRERTDPTIQKRTPMSRHETQRESTTDDRKDSPDPVSTHPKTMSHRETRGEVYYTAIDTSYDKNGRAKNRSRSTTHTPRNIDHGDHHTDLADGERAT